MAAEKALIGTAWTPDAVQAFYPVCHVNPFGAFQTPGELVHGCYLFQYQHNDQSALVALQRDVFDHGTRVHVQAVVTQSHNLQTRHLMAAIEDTARTLGADVLTLATQHAAIAAGAPRWGGCVTGAVIAKQLKKAH